MAETGGPVCLTMPEDTPRSARLTASQAGNLQQGIIEAKLDGEL